MVNEYWAWTVVALVEVTVTVLTDGFGAVAVTLKRSVTVVVAPAASVGDARTHVTVVPSCVQPVVVGAPRTRVNPAGTTSLNVRPVAVALPLLPIWIV